MENFGRTRAFKGISISRGVGSILRVRQVECRRECDCSTRGRIPPIVSIRGVEWFEVIDPTRQRSLDVQAVLSARTDSFTWELEYGLGNDPREWTSVDTGTETTAVDGVISTLDLSSIPLAEVYEKQL